MDNLFVKKELGKIPCKSVDVLKRFLLNLQNLQSDILKEKSSKNYEIENYKQKE